MNKKFNDKKSLINYKKVVKLTNFTFITMITIYFLLFTTSAFAQGELKAKIPDLCYQCHTKLKESLSNSNLHFPFKEGKCIVCHDAHTSIMKNLIKEDINALCLRCHEGVKRDLKKNYVHNALKKGLCTDCHYPHGGQNKHLLIKEEKNLCWGCHETLKEQFKKTYAHSPFSKGECASCHNPHASSEENQILDKPVIICKKCHTAKCKANEVSITFATDNMDCTSCHGGHASNTESLLGPYGHTSFLEKKCEQCHEPIVADGKITTKSSGKNLCFSCHKAETAKLKEKDFHINDTKGACVMCHNPHASKNKTLTVKESLLCFTCHETTERRIISMEKALRASPVRCIPIKERNCFQCHIPPHSQNKLYLKADEIQTCARCHVEQHKVAHPLGENVKDPRNGKPITCITCHSMHSARADFMLYYDRKRQLCIQCHKK